MSIEERMTIDERRKYLHSMRKRYQQASRPEQGRLLDEMETITGLHCKTLTRLLNGVLARKQRQQQRGCTYGAAIDAALRVIAESVDYVCAERLTPNLAWLAEHLAAHGELATTPELQGALAQISVSTVHAERHSDSLRVVQPVEPTTGIGKAMDIQLLPEAACARVTHRLRNHNLWAVDLAPWALSMMAPGGTCIIVLLRRSEALNGRRAVVCAPGAARGDSAQGRA